jgi:hypothetical protein
MDPGSHDGFQISTKNTNLVEDHPMNISVKFGSINIAWVVLKWSIFKIVSGDPDLHPRWPPSADIVLT